MRPSPSLPFARTRALASAGLAVVALLGMGACRGGGPAPDQTAAEATATITHLLLLDDASAACVGKRLAEEPDAVAALNRDKSRAPTGGQIDTLKGVLRDCVPPAVEADLYVAFARSAAPGGTIPGPAASCVQQRVLGLSRDEQDTLLIGGLLPDVAGLAFAQLVDAKILEACQLRDFTSTGRPAGPGSPTPGPADASATVVTR